MDDVGAVEAAAIRKWCSTEQGWLATRVAHHRTAIEFAIEDLSKAAARNPGPGDHAVILKVLDDLIRAVEPAPPPEGEQPVGGKRQSLCVSCDKRTGSRTARLCKSCRKAMVEDYGVAPPQSEQASLTS